MCELLVDPQFKQDARAVIEKLGPVHKNDMPRLTRIEVRADPALTEERGSAMRSCYSPDGTELDTR